MHPASRRTCGRAWWAASFPIYRGMWLRSHHVRPVRMEDLWWYPANERKAVSDAAILPCRNGVRRPSPDGDLLRPDAADASREHAFAIRPGLDGPDVGAHTRDEHPGRSHRAAGGGGGDRRAAPGGMDLALPTARGAGGAPARPGCPGCCAP